MLKFISVILMKIFLTVYAVVIIIFGVLELLLSRSIEKKPLCKTFSMINVILCIVFILISMGILEKRFNSGMLKSSIIGALSLALIYFADMLGSRLGKKP